jgi:enoyl-CoA hydratase
MDFQTIVCRKENNLMIIELIGSEIVGAGISELAYELSDVCDSIKSDNSVWAVSIIGSGEKAFLPGIDKNEGNMKISAGADGKLWSIVEPISGLYQPVLVGINGDAMGPGLEMALACDIRIASDASYFGMPHVREGLIPWDGGTQRLSRLVGRAKAIEMILTGEIINAQEAHRIGLVHKVVTNSDLMNVAMNMAREIASKGPIALRYAKEAIYKGMDLTLEQGLRLEADLYFLLHTAHDRKEGIKAFQEKRMPHFRGR